MVDVVGIVYFFLVAIGSLLSGGKGKNKEKEIEQAIKKENISDDNLFERKSAKNSKIEAEDALFTGQDGYHDLRWALVFASLAIVVISYAALNPNRNFDDILSNYSDFETKGFVLSVLTGFLYPIVGAFVVRFCALLRKLAYFGKVEPWSRTTILGFALIWPVTCIFSFFIYPCLFFVHLLF